MDEKLDMLQNSGLLTKQVHKNDKSLGSEDEDLEDIDEEDEVTESLVGIKYSRTGYNILIRPLEQRQIPCAQLHGSTHAPSPLPSRLVPCKY